MNVTIKCRLNSRFPEAVYADMYEGDELLVSATLGYCVAVANEHGHTIANAQDVLVWLNKNSDFVGGH